MSTLYEFFNPPSSPLSWRHPTETEKDKLGIKNIGNVLISDDIQVNEPYNTDYKFDIKLCMINWNIGFVWFKEHNPPNNFKNINNYFHVEIINTTRNTNQKFLGWNINIPFEQNDFSFEIITFDKYKLKIYSIDDQYKLNHPKDDDNLWWESDEFEFPYIFLNYEFESSLASIDVRNKYVPTLDVSNNHYSVKDLTTSQSSRFFIKCDHDSFKEENLDISSRGYTKYSYLYKYMDLSNSDPYDNLPSMFRDSSIMTKSNYHLGYKYDTYNNIIHFNPQLNVSDDTYYIQTTEGNNNIIYDSNGYYYVDRKMDHEFKISCVIHNDTITSEPTNPNAIKTYNKSFNNQNTFIQSNLEDKQIYSYKTKNRRGKVTGIRARRNIYIKSTNKLFINNDLYFINGIISNITHGTDIAYNGISSNHKEIQFYCEYEITNTYKLPFKSTYYNDFEINFDVELTDIFNNKYTFNINDKQTYMR